MAAGQVTNKKIKILFIAITGKAKQAIQKIWQYNNAAQKKLNASSAKGHKQQMSQGKQQLKQAEKNDRAMRGMMLGRNLSWMFFGMMLQRTMGRVFRSLFNTYQTATKGQTALGKATTRLSANWEFLKFTIMEALNQPWFVSFIDWIGGAIAGLSEWVQENEVSVAFILAAFAAVFTFGTGIMIFSQFALAYFATTAWMASKKGGMSPFAKGGAARKAFKGFMKFIAAAAVVYFTIEGFEAISEGDFKGLLKNALLGYGILKWGLRSPYAFGITIALVIGGLLFHGGFFDKLKENMASLGENPMSWLGGFLGGSAAFGQGTPWGKAAFDAIGDSISNFFKTTEDGTTTMQNATTTQTAFNESVKGCNESFVDYADNVGPSVQDQLVEMQQSYQDTMAEIEANTSATQLYNAELDNIPPDVYTTIHRKVVTTYESNETANY